MSMLLVVCIMHEALPALPGIEQLSLREDNERQNSLYFMCYNQASFFFIILVIFIFYLFFLPRTDFGLSHLWESPAPPAGLPVMRESPPYVRLVQLGSPVQGPRGTGNRTPDLPILQTDSRTLTQLS